MYNIYKHINKNGEIIYIGKSKNLLSRQRNHRDNSSWFSEVENIEYITLDSKIEMDIAELYLINKFSPINNKKDNRADNISIVNINENWIKFDLLELKVKNKAVKMYNFGLIKPRSLYLSSYSEMKSLTKEKLLFIDIIILHLISNKSHDKCININYRDFLNKYSKNNTKYNVDFFIELSKSIIEYKFQNENLEYNMFDNIEINTDTISVEVSDIFYFEIIKCISNKRGISYDIDFIYDNLKICEILLYQLILSTFNSKVKSLEFTIDSFKKYCGINSKNNRYIKSTILTSIDNINKNFKDIQIGVDFDDTGKYKSIKNVNLWIMGEPLIDVDNL